MGKQVPITAPKERPLYVGSIVVPAGETKMFDENDVPRHLRAKQPAPVAAPPPTPTPSPDAIDEAALAEIFARPGKDVIAGVPGLKDAELVRLAALEQERMVNGSQATRKTVLEAIAEEQLARASAAQDSTGGGSQG